MSDYGYVDVGELADYANNQATGITANEIMRFPRADVQPVKRGHWINVTGDDYECSECKAAVWSRNANPIENYHYCWRCGAKMDDAKPIKG